MSSQVSNLQCTPSSPTCSCPYRSRFHTTARFPSPRAATHASRNCGNSAAYPHPRASQIGSLRIRPLRHTPEISAADAREGNRHRKAECGPAGGPATAAAAPGNDSQSKLLARSGPLRQTPPDSPCCPCLHLLYPPTHLHRASYGPTAHTSHGTLARRLLQARGIRHNVSYIAFASISRYSPEQHSSPLLHAALCSAALSLTAITGTHCNSARDALIPMSFSREQVQYSLLRRLPQAARMHHVFESMLTRRLALRMREPSMCIVSTILMLFQNSNSTVLDLVFLNFVQGLNHCRRCSKVSDGPRSQSRALKC